MDRKELADLIFPEAKEVSYYEEKYPERDLPEGAQVVRVAPSPTGFIHVGGIFQGLIAKKIAQQTGGVFFVRIEDTDQKRKIENGNEEILNAYKDYDLYLVSNGTKKVQEGRMSTANISHCFKDIFISEVVGYEKPNVEFFNYVFSKIKDFNRDETVIIGDSLTSDILGGKNAKIKTVWFNPNGKKCEDIVPDYQISSLNEVKSLLNSI